MGKYANYLIPIAIPKETIVNMQFRRKCHEAGKLNALKM
jgi:hypothetical protein